MSKDTIELDANYITINYENRGEYNIEKYKVDTEKKLQWWLDHLQEKTWFDCITMKQFVDTVKTSIISR